jgi:hypothetical protein
MPAAWLIVPPIDLPWADAAARGQPPSLLVGAAAHTWPCMPHAAASIVKHGAAWLAPASHCPPHCDALVLAAASHTCSCCFLGFVSHQQPRLLCRPRGHRRHRSAVHAGMHPCAGRSRRSLLPCGMRSWPSPAGYSTRTTRPLWVPAFVPTTLLPNSSTGGKLREHPHFLATMTYDA